MLLVVDVGNTNTVVGLLDLPDGPSGRVGALRAHWRLETRARRTADEYAATLHQLTQIAKLPFTFSGGIVSTVVPAALFACTRFFEDYCGIRPFIVGPGIKSGMPILVDTPKEVGADRIVNSVAAFERFHQGCIVVDFGTATTFDLVTPRGEYAGGAIATGITTSADALYQAAAKLPKVEFTRPPSVIGKNTVNSMQAGLYYGYVGLTDEIVTRMRAAVDYPCKVVATGGLATLIAKESKTIEHTDEMLTLTGLGILWERNR
jgi:type III pantothenate kinase